MRRLPLLLAALILVAAEPAAAQAQAVTDPGGPLVYVVVVDGLDGDRVDTGRAPNLSALLAGGDGTRATYFRESRSIMIAETNPNHTAMATGAYGDRSGIPGNTFAVYGPTKDGDSCALTGPGDESKPPTEVSGENADCLQAQTFFEAIQRGAGADGAVTAGIFGKPKLARIFDGRRADGNRYDADYLWTPCGNGSDAPYCKEGVPTRPNDSYTVNDSSVMDEVLRTVKEGVPGDGRTFAGGGRRPNLTFVNMPGVDSSGHATGAGAEYDRAIGAADGQLQRFVVQQKALGLWDRTVMIVLSDHSMDSTPEKTTLAARFQRAGIPSGDFRIIQNGSAALVYLTDRTAATRFALLKRMRAAAIDGAAPSPAAPFGPPAVEALYREANPDDGGLVNTLDARHPAWRLNGPRTGDLVVTSQSATSFNDPINPLAGNHGGPQTRDNLLAVAGGHPAIEQRAIEGAQDPLFDDTERNPTQAENVDVAPTVMRLLGRAPPAQSEGRVLTEAFRPDLLPAATEPNVPGQGPAAAATCAAGAGFRSAAARRAGRGLSFRFSRRVDAPVAVDVFQVSAGTRIFGNRRVARFTGRERSFRWSGRGGRLRDGLYFARLRIRAANGRTDVRRVALERRGGRFRVRPAFHRRESCGAIASFKLERPAFGGRTNRALGATYRLTDAGRVTVELLRGARVVRRIAPASDRRGGRTFRVRIGAEGLRRGDHRVRIRVTAGGRTTTAALTARRL